MEKRKEKAEYIIIALIETSVILAVINFMGTFAFAQKIISWINSSVIVKMLFEHNIITNIILSKIM